MPERVRMLARVLPSPIDRVVERSHARYVGIRSRRLSLREEEPIEYDSKGLPLPPARLRQLVSGFHDSRRWLATGEFDAAFIASLLEAHGRSLDRLDVILDFGCGCGRVARWWSDLSGPQIYACDYDGMLTEWCRTNLPFLKVKTNASRPPLPFKREFFDLIYAISLLTHLKPEAQDAWMADVRRHLKRDGLFLFTVHGERFCGHLNAEQKVRFANGELVVLYPELSGREACAAFHPPSYVQNTLVREHGFELVATVYEDRDRQLGSPMGLQDSYLVRRSES